MKFIKTIKFGMLSLVLISSLGCETESSESGTSAKINKDTINLNGNELINYIYDHEKAVLNASDCLKLSGQDWANLYGDIIYHIAPAEPMAKSVDTCRAVKFTVEAGYSLEQASRQSIKQGWINDIATTGNIESSDYITSQDQEQQDRAYILNMNTQQCNQRFSGYDSQELFDLTMDEMQKASDLEISEQKRYEHKLMTLMASHCREVMYGE